MSFLQVILLLAAFYPVTTMAIEEPRYEVEKKYGEFEIRKYGSVLVAQTENNESFEDSGNKAFRILADYIFGNNVSKTKIAMTAPVTQQSEKIAMTASYSGSWSEEKYNKKLSEFKAHLEKEKIKTIGEPIFARFNSPFQLWFLRRNEIWLEVAD